MNSECTEMTYGSQKLPIQFYRIPPENTNLPRFIFCHGVTMTGHDFEKVMYASAKIGFQPVSFDFPGHGKSGWAERQNYTYENHTELLSQIIAHTGHTPYVLVGTSMGGAIAQEYLGNPQTDTSNCMGLCLVDVGPHVPAPLMTKIYNNLNKPLAHQNREQAMQNISGLFSGMDFETDQARANYLKNKLIFENDEWRHEWDQNITHMLEAPIAHGGHNLHEQFKNIVAKNIPLMLVAGDRREVLNEETLAFMKAQAPQMEIEPRPKANHVPIFNTPEQMAGLLKFAKEKALVLN